MDVLLTQGVSGDLVQSFFIRQQPKGVCPPSNTVGFMAASYTSILSLFHANIKISVLAVKLEQSTRRISVIVTLGMRVQLALIFSPGRNHT
uniref:Uncharacterized protein n=1 Tax=Trichuris muris TaxID=70415 RepID=A0A5S6Q948_TRIMR